ncbi:MAG: ABC-type phosphate/phosphonate transport system substrate-binding protein [Candidatus Latescibacterota bacterium]|jgi:ABC-type phosphate/phosphonate transport system substrate-binding protein
MTVSYIDFAPIYKLILLVAVISNGVFFQPANAAGPQISSMKLGFTSGTLYDVDLNDARAAQETWLRSIIQNVNKNKLEIEVKTIVYANVSEASEAIKKNEIDAVILLPLEYLALGDAVPVIPIMTSRSGDNEGDYYVIATHKQSNIQTIEQLQSQNLIISIKGNNGIPKLWLETILLENKLPNSDTFFGAIKHVSKTTQAILPVFFKQADVCLVPKTDLGIAMALNPQLKTNLQIVQQSPGYNRIIVCVQSTFYEKNGDFLSEAIETVNQATQGQQLLTLFRVNNLSRFEEAHLDNIKKLVHTYQTLNKASTLSQDKLSTIGK